MLNIIEILSILFIHWFADFVLQTNEQALKKRTEIKFLYEHIKTYVFAWFFFLMIGLLIHDKLNIWNYNKLDIFYFCIITFILHGITDYITSKINHNNIPKRIYSEKDSDFFIYESENWHNFFVGIGFDQILHYIQLFLTYYLIFKN